MYIVCCSPTFPSHGACREVGATVTPTTIVKSEADDLAPGGTRSRSYVVTLLPGGTKTLGESLPAIKLNKGKK